MPELLIAIAIFLCLSAVGLGSLTIHELIPLHQRLDDTHQVVKVAANIFVVMASLVLGLLVNSAKNTFEAIDGNVHAFAAELLILDQMLRQSGPSADEARRNLAAYVQRAVDGTWPVQGTPVIDDRSAERLLEDVGAS